MSVSWRQYPKRSSCCFCWSWLHFVASLIVLILWVSVFLIWTSENDSHVWPADNEDDVDKGCEGLSGIYSTRVMTFDVARASLPQCTMRVTFPMYSHSSIPTTKNKKHPGLIYWGFGAASRTKKNMLPCVEGIERSSGMLLLVWKTRQSSICWHMIFLFWGAIFMVIFLLWNLNRPD